MQYTSCTTMRGNCKKHLLLWIIPDWSNNWIFWRPSQYQRRGLCLTKHRLTSFGLLSMLYLLGQSQNQKHISSMNWKLEGTMRWLFLSLLVCIASGSVMWSKLQGITWNAQKWSFSTGNEYCDFEGNKVKTNFSRWRIANNQWIYPHVHWAVLLPGMIIKVCCIPRMKLVTLLITCVSCCIYNRKCDERLILPWTCQYVIYFHSCSCFWWANPQKETVVLAFSKCSILEHNEVIIITAL